MGIRVHPHTGMPVQVGGLGVDFLDVDVGSSVKPVVASTLTFLQHHTSSGLPLASKPWSSPPTCREAYHCSKGGSICPYTIHRHIKVPKYLLVYIQYGCVIPSKACCGLWPQQWHDDIIPAPKNPKIHPWPAEEAYHCKGGPIHKGCTGEISNKKIFSNPFFSHCNLIDMVCRMNIRQSRFWKKKMSETCVFAFFFLAKMGFWLVFILFWQLVGPPNPL